MAATRVFKCPQCPSTAITFRNLLRHIQVTHSQQNDWNITCGVDGCQRTYRLFSSFKKHLYREHRHLIQGAGAPRVHDLHPPIVSPEPSDSVCDLHPTAVQRSVHFNDTDTGSHEIVTCQEASIKYISLLLLKMKEKRGLPETTINELAQDMYSLMEVYHENYSAAIGEQLQKTGFDVRSNGKLIELLSENHFRDSFRLLHSSAERQNYWKTCLPHVAPVTVRLGNRQSYQYIPIAKVIGILLGDESVWENVNRPTGEENAEILTDFVDGQFSKAQNLHIDENGKRKLMIHLYMDEFEVCNPLGAQRGKHKILGVYFSLLNLSPQYRSQISNIHPTILVKNTFVDKFGLDKILQPLISDINQLSRDGIVSHGRNMKGTIVIVSADNLASHKLGGFQQSFAKNRICRFCMASREQINDKVDEANFVIRSTAVHRYHVTAVQNHPDLEGVYGVKGSSALSAVEGFDATTCLPPDVMHDMLEGVVTVTLKCILKHFVTSRYFTLEELNESIDQFEYGPADATSKPPPVSRQSVFGESGLKGSASQNWCFCRLLPMFVGSAIPENDEAWQLYLLLRQMLDVIMAPIVPKDQIAPLATTIRDYHITFRELFPEKMFTPKMHYIIHYPRLMLFYGPLVKLWTMRYEGKHQYFKQLARKLHNFINICKTLATRHQYLQSYTLSNRLLDQPIETTGGAFVLRKSLPDSLLNALDDLGFGNEDERIYQLKGVSVYNIKYQVACLLITSFSDDEIPRFAQVKRILKADGKLLLCCKTFNTLYFDEHFHSYAVELTANWAVLEPGHEKSHHPLHLYEKDERNLIPLKYGVWKN